MHCCNMKLFERCFLFRIEPPQGAERHVGGDELADGAHILAYNSTIKNPGRRGGRGVLEVLRRDRSCRLGYGGFCRSAWARVPPVPACEYNDDDNDPCDSLTTHKSISYLLMR